MGMSVTTSPTESGEQRLITRWELGRMVAMELGQSSLRPSVTEVKVAATNLGVKPSQARQALTVFNDPDGGTGPKAREVVLVKILRGNGRGGKL